MYVALLLWFNIFPGLNFIFVCLKLVNVHYHAPKQRKIKYNIAISHFTLVCVLFFIFG